MRNILFAAMTLTATIVLHTAQAAERQPPATAASGQSLYTCSTGGLSRVASTADPAPCCTGSFGCPQLLSNTGLIKPKRDNRT